MNSPPRGGKPSHDNPGGHAYLGLRALAKRHGRTSAEYLRLYALEGFLLRLESSRHREDLILKGGVLLAAYDLRRPTADIDFAALHQSNDVEQVRRLVLAIAQTDLTDAKDDGLRFDTTGARAEVIREDDSYSGVRVTLAAALATARETFHVDVNVGDPIWPAPQTVAVPRLLGGSIYLRGYPLVMVLAEKLVTATQRGTSSTRWRDFADIYLLTGRHEFNAATARAALEEVARHRQVQIEPLRTTLADYAQEGQTRWSRWRGRLNLQDRLPDDFGEVLGATFDYHDPLLARATVPEHHTWSPAARRWQP